MPKPILVVFLGDLHCGSPFGVAKPGWVYESQGKKPVSLNPGQRWLWSNWQKTVNDIKARAKGFSLVVMYGGDCTEGYHHNHIDAEGAPIEQKDMAVELLRPLANVADRFRVALGTVSHVGVNGERDAALASDLSNLTRHRVVAKWFHRVEIGGRIIHWAHKMKGMTMSDNPVAESNGMRARARRDYFWYRERGARPPDLIVCHHFHRSPDTIREKNIQVAVCPAFQLPTNHGGEEYAGGMTDIGYLLYWPERNDLEQVIYPQEVETERIGR